jgi:hypothetical protein
MAQWRVMMGKYLMLLMMICAASNAAAQDPDLNKAYDACRQHIKYIILSPSGRSNPDGWEKGWEMCSKVESAWVAARKAADEETQRNIIEKVLPGLDGGSK